MKIDVYQKLSKPSVLNQIEVQEWFDLIRNSDYTQKIIDARNNPFQLKALKQNLPCVTYNFLYRRYKKDCNIISSTGLIFIDIDHPSFNPSMIDKKRILGYYKSVSGNGYHILVRIDAITQSNFKTSYKAVCEDLGILEFVDINAIKHSQFSLLSFDEDAYFNHTPFIYSAELYACPAIDLTATPLKHISCIPFEGILKNQTAYTSDGDTNLRFDNLDEISIPEGEKYVVNWEGYDYVKCWIPIKKLKDGRKRFMLSYVTNLVWLNGAAEYERLFSVMHNVNQIACEVPLSPKILYKILNGILKRLHSGNLYPILFNKKRKIVFDKYNFYSKGEKLDMVLQELAIKKTDDSIVKMKEILSQWKHEFGKITARNIFNLCKSKRINVKISSKTINKYYKHFKSEILEINSTIINHKSIVTENECKRILYATDWLVHEQILQPMSIDTDIQNLNLVAA